MKRESKHRILTVGIFFIAAAAVRIVYIVQFSASPFFDPQVMDLDAAAYDAAAVRLASGDWFGTGVFEMMPGFAYVLGILYALIGRHIFAAYILQVCLGAAVVPFVYLMADRLAGKRAAVAAAIGAVISQSLVFHTGMLTGDTFATLMAVAVVYMLIRAVNGERAWPFIVAGAFAGLGVLFRGTIAIFILLFVPWYVISHRHLGLGRTLSRCVLVIVAAVVVIAPITIRNYVVGSDFVPVASHGGLNIYLGYNPYAGGGLQRVPELGTGRQGMIANAKRIAEAKVGRELKPSEVSRFWRNRAIQYVRNHPRKALLLVRQKALLFFNHDTRMSDVGSLSAMKCFSTLLKWFLIPFGLISVAGMVGMIVWPVRKEKRKGIGLLYLFILANLLAVILIFVNSRYRLTTVPFLLVFAGVAVDYIIQSMRRPGRLVIIALLIVICSMIVYRPMVKAESPAEIAKNIGHAFLRAKQPDKAERAYLRAIGEDDSFIPAYFELGALYWKQERFDESERMIEEMLKRQPTFVPALNSMGNAMLHKGDREGAVRYWKKSLDINPNQPEIRAKVQENVQ